MNDRRSEGTKLCGSVRCGQNITTARKRVRVVTELKRRASGSWVQHINTCACIVSVYGQRKAVHFLHSNGSLRITLSNQMAVFKKQSKRGAIHKCNKPSVLPASTFILRGTGGIRWASLDNRLNSCLSEKHQQSNCWDIQEKCTNLAHYWAMESKKEKSYRPSREMPSDHKRKAISNVVRARQSNVESQQTFR